MSAQNPNLGNAQIVLNTHAEATFQIPDVTKVLAVPDLLKLYMQPAVVALAEKIETRSAEPVFAVHGEHGGGHGGNADHRSGRSTRRRRRCSRRRCRRASRSTWWWTATTYSQLRQIPRFSEYQTAGEAGLRALVDGTVGKIKDFFVFRSQFVPKTGSGPVNDAELAFTKNAIGLVIRRLPQPLPGTGAIAEYAELGNFGMRVLMSYQPNTLAQQFTVDVLYGCGGSAQQPWSAGPELASLAI